ncbi:MAG: hypothetical protein NTW95_12095 [Candidatus Aminicenantes bacterium]|nr:hypothetical protein [Candidatus Aminicenantes bacterium]
MENMVPVLILAVIGYFVLELVKVVTDSRLRAKLIEKGMVDEKIKPLFNPHSVLESASSLKWGLVMIAVGLAFIFTFAIHEWVPVGIRGEITAGAVFFMAGLAMLIYYAIARSQEKKE